MKSPLLYVQLHLHAYLAFTSKIRGKEWGHSPLPRLAFRCCYIEVAVLILSNLQNFPEKVCCAPPVACQRKWDILLSVRQTLGSSHYGCCVEFQEVLGLNWILASSSGSSPTTATPAGFCWCGLVLTPFLEGLGEPVCVSWVCECSIVNFCLEKQERELQLAVPMARDEGLSACWSFKG